ncbi:hypothetical protein M409DRAFT_60462 [Zasmidium cellare ATCC 36951]|uniref:DUF2423 domain-containing protein n=1 Tax=Zasmidium cellare ATCC 36951 TaxID=1080233 RepID=A0A6A6C2B4_ZASCE|nr:uncharacterized protein M409DRAFT_60462 [Zasmidium cellare ATCC 36951]KAF2159869.1 hypothetical protein M409DRAFT_60462 [Zasmidium cellare ATCC 36951]
MAKSARASRTKANNQALKKKVFGPVETARNERLNAKLLELAQQPKEKMEVEQEEPAETTTAKDSEPAGDMDLDESTGRPQRSKREIKRLQDQARTQRVEKNKRKKPRNQVTFPSRKKKGGKK